MKASLFAQAQFAAKAGALPPGVDNEYGYMLLVLAGVDMGLLPTTATRTLHLLSGKPSLSAQAMMGLANVAGVRMRVIEYNEERVTAEFTREGYHTHETSFSIEEAKKANLVKERSAWVKTPKDMLLARTITRGLRYIAADIVTGLYAVEELNDGVESVDLSPELRAKFDTRDVDLNALAAQAIEMPPEARTDPAGTPPKVEAKTTATSTQFVDALGGGKVTEAGLNLNQGLHIPLTVKGSLPDVPKTTAAIFAAFAQLYGEDLAKNVLKQKVESYGAASAAKLSPIDFMDLYRWADGEVARKGAETPDAPIEEQAPESPEHITPEIPAFDPHRGAATRAGGAVADSVPAGTSLDDRIMAKWQELAAADKDEAANSVFEKYDYEVGKAGVSAQTKRLILEDLAALDANAAD